MIYVSWIFAILIIIATFFHLLLIISKKKTFANSFIALGVIYVLGFCMWLFAALTCNSEETVITNIFQSFYKSFKMFAFGNDATFFAETGALSELYEKITTILCVYVAQICAFGVISSALIQSYYLTFAVKRYNFSRYTKFYKRDRNEPTYNYSSNYLFTDLPFEEIKPFLQNVRCNEKATIKVIILKQYAATQNGSELLETLRINLFDTGVEHIDLYALRKFCSLKKSRTVNFYSMFCDDKYNLEFAKCALRFLNDDKKGIEAKNIGNVNFYISIQDESYNSKTDLLKKSDGRIRLINEYEMVANKFIFENPITRFVDFKPDTFDVDFDNEKNFHVHFLGLGFINKSMASKMLSLYQFPSDKTHVKYHVHIKENSEEAMRGLYGNFACFSDVFKDRAKYLEQLDISEYFDASDCDAENSDNLFNLAKSIVDNIVESKDANFAKHLVMISLGNGELNLNVALKLREFVKDIAESYGGDTLHKNSRYKSVIIYPYVKDNNYFVQGTDVFNMITYTFLYDLDNIISPIKKKIKQLKDDLEVAEKHEKQASNNLKELEKQKCNKGDNEFYKENLSKVEEFRKQIFDISKEIKIAEGELKKVEEATKQKVKNLIDSKDVLNLLNTEKYKELISAAFKGSFALLDSKNKECKISNYFSMFKSYIFETNFVDAKNYVPSKNLEYIPRNVILDLLKHYRMASFIYEECPIVVYGRGGYLGDNFDNALLRLAKMVNKSYDDNCETEEDINNSWYSLSYPQQQSNYGVALSIQAKLNLIGYKLVWDQKNIIRKYGLLKDSEKESYKNSLRSFERVILETYKDSNNLSLINKHCDFENIFGEAISKNPEKVIHELNPKLRSNLPANDLSLESIGYAFVATYEDAYNKYISGSDDENVIKMVENAVIDYFNIVYKSRLNKKVLSLRCMEHTRWYISNAVLGMIPQQISSITYNGSRNKSRDKMRHICNTTNAGLDELCIRCLKDMVRSRKIFSYDGGSTFSEGKSISDFTFRSNEFDEWNKKEKYVLFSNLYDLIFSSDILGYEATSKCLFYELQYISDNKYWNNIRNTYFFVVTKK